MCVCVCFLSAKAPPSIALRPVHESRMMALFRMIILTACQIILTVRMMGHIPNKYNEIYKLTSYNEKCEFPYMSHNFPFHHPGIILDEIAPNKLSSCHHPNNLPSVLGHHPKNFVGLG